MIVRDPQCLDDLIEINDVSRRAVARAAEWRSHSYLLRLLSGEARTCTPEAAGRIAAFLGVNVTDIFMPDESSEAGHYVQRDSHGRSDGS